MWQAMTKNPDMACCSSEYLFEEIENTRDDRSDNPWECSNCFTRNFTEKSSESFELIFEPLALEDSEIHQLFQHHQLAR